MRNSFFKTMMIIIISTSFIFTFCDDGITNVEIIDSGLKGHVFDTKGNPIRDVEIFCLYNNRYFPQPAQTLLKNTLLNNKKDFNFELFQNYPNPFSSSTYIRYSLPQKCKVEIKITRKNNIKPIYSYSSDLPYGYYQHYLNSIVDSLKLENGLYVYNIKAIGEDNTEYNATKEMMVIASEGKGNASAKTTGDGEFNFDFEDAFIGDSVIVNIYDDYYSANVQYLTNTVNFVFVKPGYGNKYLTIELYPDFLLVNDIVLIEEN